MSFAAPTTRLIDRFCALFFQERASALAFENALFQVEGARGIPAAFPGDAGALPLPCPFRAFFQDIEQTVQRERAIARL